MWFPKCEPDSGKQIKTERVEEKNCAVIPVLTDIPAPPPTAWWLAFMVRAVSGSTVYCVLSLCIAVIYHVHTDTTAG